jgi:rhamnulokinase
MSGRQVAAIDLGATSGRVIVGDFSGGGLALRHVARFPNEPVRTRDGLHWDLLGLYRDVLDGLARAEREAPGQIVSVGVDSWAVDYALLRDGAPLGMPYHYRDARTEAGVRAVHARVGARELFERNGLQHLPFTTLFQLAVDHEHGVLDLADTLLLVPDLFAYWLTGAVGAERTNASTTGLLDARTGEWDRDLAGLVGVPAGALPDLVEPGAPLGALTPDVAAVVGRSIELTAVGSHDTASAVVAVPSGSRDTAYVSCGTWGLVGLELDAPVLTEEARLAGFTNELGVDGRVRFLHNVMGLWLLSESIRSWYPGATSAQQASVLQELLAAAAAVTGEIVLFDVDDPRFLAPGDLPARIREWCDEHDVAAPATRAVTVRSILESMAEAFVDTVRRGESVSGHAVRAVHVVGGGSHNALLCQSIANRSGLPVLAGPAEATAIGNILVQARARGLVSGDLESLRAIVAAQFPPTRYAPATHTVLPRDH